MTTISSIGATSVATTSARTSQSLGQTDFLRLMTAQLKEQDPFSPVDNQQMVAQMAQMSSSTGIAEMNVSLKAIAEQISTQTQLLQDIRSATAPVATA
jgi:flagellar basal-body rod modification protein FlgD